MEPWFSPELLGWYRSNKRNLPWRGEQDPYKIWISEIILQQTQVIQGTAYYYRFIQKFPTVKELALAHEDEVLKLWQGLGYYSRARNLHAAAKTIVFEYGGKIPPDFDKIKLLKGVGDYTASAIASFAFNLPYAVLDGNVYRLLSRLFGIKTPIDTGRAKKEFSLLANAILNIKKPALHNQAIMEFGSQFCKPVKPNCQNCIFNHKCVAFNEDTVHLLPIKSKKVKIKKRYFNYLVLVDSDKDIRIEKRVEKDIWQGLYQFPLIETSKSLSVEELFATREFKQSVKQRFDLLLQTKQYKHVLTHQHLFAGFYVLRLKTKHKLSQNKTKIDGLSKLAFPRLIELFMNDYNLKEIIKFGKII